MGFTIAPLLILIGILLAVAVGIALLVAIIGPLSRAIGWVFSRVFSFVGGMLRDTLRLIGGLITSLVFVPLIGLNVLIGRWSASSHYGRALQGELKAIGGCLYRMLIGHWARLLGLSDLTEGIERRVPEAVLAAPTADRPRGGKSSQFEGYQIVGSLPGGGSGGKLFVASPTPEKRAALARQGQPDVDRVVIKMFSLRDGSTLPQIIRENRALPAARRLGLILEHELTEERFYYVTRYVPGEPLSLIGQRLHAESGPEGLDRAALAKVLGYTADLLRTLRTYHDGGLWHKDVKPDNIIVAGGAAHLVDFGLITPLRSSMTLTTHGTEYFRDPEMVRMALRGVKVHEVDGSRFDLYAAGAVLYSLIEDSFPAHAGLSQISKRCPDAVKWITRRAMTDYDKRYASAGVMLADVQAVLTAPDPFALKPIDLPSMKSAGSDAAAELLSSAARAAAQPSHPWEADEPAFVAPAAAVGTVSAVHAAAGSFAGSVPAAREPAAAPRLRVTDWWTGRYAVDPSPQEPRPSAVSVAGSPAPARTPGSAFGVNDERSRGPGSTAAEQLVRARARAREARERAQRRIDARRASYEPAGINFGVVVGVLVFIALLAVVLLPGVLMFGRSVPAAPTQPLPAPEDGAWMVGASDLDLTAWNRSPVPSQSELPTVVVLREPAAFSPESLLPIHSAMRRLAEMGFTIAGEAPADVASDADNLQGNFDVAASLRTAIGVSPFGSAAARQAVQRWLSESERPVVALWIARDRDGEPTVWAVARGAGAQPGLRAVVDAFTPGVVKDGTVDGNRRSDARRPAPPAR